MANDLRDMTPEMRDEITNAAMGLPDANDPNEKRSVVEVEVSVGDAARRVHRFERFRLVNTQMRTSSFSWRYAGTDASVERAHAEIDAAAKKARKPE